MLESTEAPARPPPMRLVTVRSPEAIAAARSLVREYAESLTVDLCFQGLDGELSGLPGDYAEPAGLLLLACVGDRPAACGAFRPLANVDHANACEMKRLYVRPAFRRQGLGRLLVEALMVHAAEAGYSVMLLDTLDDMEAARGLYATHGFHETAPYYQSPIAGAHYLAAALGEAGMRRPLRY